MTAPLHVLHLANLYPPMIGGLGHVVATTSEELVRRGHHVTVLTLRLPGTPTREIRNGVRIVRVRGSVDLVAPRLHADPNQPHLPSCPDPLVLSAIRRLLASGRFHLAHSHDWIAYSYLPLRHTRYGIPLVHTAHDYGLVCPKRTLLAAEPARSMRPSNGLPCSGPSPPKCLRCAPEQYGWVKGTLMTFARHVSNPLHDGVDRLLAVSTAVAEALHDDRVARRGLEIVPAFVPDGLEELASSATRPPGLTNNPYLLFAGALGPHKGLHVLFDAYRLLQDDPELKDRLPDLVCIGTPRPDTPPAPPGVRMLHNVPHPQVMAAWHGATVGVVPSVWPDPCPLVAIEAMLAGTPLVASATGGLPDLVSHEQTGLLVPPGDAAALAGAIRRLLLDEGLRAQLISTARQYARGYTATPMVDRLEEIYRQIIEIPSTTRP